MRKLFLINFLFAQCLSFAIGQSTAVVTSKSPAPANLVLNASFEEWEDSTKVSKKETALQAAKSWTVPDKSTPSLISSNPDGSIYDRYGSSWKFKARNGKNVAGVNIEGDRDYIQGKLSESLVVGKKYYFFFFVHYHCSGANGIGITFLPQKMQLKEGEKLNLQAATYQRELTEYSKLPEKTWVLVVDSFIAQRSYQYFIIGNFLSKEDTKLESGGHHYAFIDDVYVMAAKNDRMPEARKADSPTEKQKWEDNDKTIFKGAVPKFLEQIQFKYNSDVLDESSFPKLDSVATTLSMMTTVRLRIKGHTSTEGDATYNQKLSQRRATAVMDYLIRKGIAVERLSALGLGASYPKIATESNEDDRNINRRVEFEVLQ